MIKIETKTQFPYICNKALKDGILTEKPFTFISGNYTQNLTEPQYKKLKELAVKEESDKKQDKEKGDKELTGLELLKSKYESLKDKKSSEAANLRKQIKELEEQEKKGSK